MNPPVTLAADIGGTHCRLALFRGGALIALRVHPTAGCDLAQFTRDLLSDSGLDATGPDAAGIAVAGPVRGGRARLTNGAATFDEAVLSKSFGCPVRLLNDFEAAARGVPTLASDGWIHVHGPRPDPRGHAVVLGPGTGLGQAILLPVPDGWRVLPTEGGHADLAPGRAIDLVLWSWLTEHCGHVSWERALSGPGICNLYAFHRSQGAEGPPETDPARITASDAPAALMAVAAFRRLLGAQAGNLALTLLPSGGVWIAGGILPKIGGLDAVAAAFVEKGRMSELVAGIPLCVVTDPHLGLRGACASVSFQEGVGSPSRKGVTTI